MDQLALDLGHRPAFTREDFLIAPSNEAAMGWIDRWPDWPATALALSGPARAGKSHLARIWQAKASARFLLPETLASDRLPKLLGKSRAVLVDPADGAAEEPLLHLYNLLAERGGHLLIVACEPPSRWTIALADLRSRLVASPTVAVATPDEDLLGALLVKLFSDRQLVVAREVLAYLVLHLERSFAAADAAVTALDRAALAEHRRITVPLARRVLGFNNEMPAAEAIDLSA